MYMTTTDWIVLGCITVAVIISIVWQIRLARRNRAAARREAEQTEETV